MLIVLSKRIRPLSFNLMNLLHSPYAEPPVDAFPTEAHQNHNRHLLGFSLDAPLSSNPPCSQDMSALDPFGFMQASIQRAFDTGTGLVPGPATTFECEMTPDGQGQRCVDRDIVIYTAEEERELTSGQPDEIDFSWGGAHQLGGIGRRVLHVCFARALFAAHLVFWFFP
jgi:hypothetical protein